MRIEAVTIYHGLMVASCCVVKTTKQKTKNQKAEKLWFFAIPLSMLVSSPKNQKTKKPLSV
jgi:hypothetical protein